MYKLALAFVSLIFVVATPASAAGNPSATWVVTQLSGDARVVHPGAQPASLKVNNQLSPGDTLLTGPSGRATLVRGGDYIIVAPHSELRVPSTPQPSGFTRVVQNLGTLLFRVQHTGIPHFAVDTPMLAAVVKGTTFTVVVDGNRSAVQVIDGLVQVSTIDGAMSRMVEGGRTVFVNHDHPKMLLDADKPLPATSSPAATSVTVSAAGESPLAAIGSLTGGLVRADLSAPQPAVVMAPMAVAANAAPASTGAAPTPTSEPTQGSAPAIVTATATTAVTAAPAGVVDSTVSVVTSATAPVVTAAPVVASTVPVVTSVTSPIVTATTTAVTVPAISTPVVSTSAVTVPIVTASTAIVPSVSTPTVTVASISTPSVTTPILAVEPVTTPVITVPTVQIASNSGPGSMNSGPGGVSVTPPTLTVPSVTTPTITTPLVTVPSVSTPTITLPTTTITAPILSLLKP